MTLKRWNWKKREYENYDVPDSRCVKTFVADLDTIIDCASCGNGIPYGCSYTSMEIHNAMGLGYAVCDECYEKEEKRRKENKRCSVNTI